MHATTSSLLWWNIACLFVLSIHYWFTMIVLIIVSCNLNTVNRIHTFIFFKSWFVQLLLLWILFRKKTLWWGIDEIKTCFLRQSPAAATQPVRPVQTCLPPHRRQMQMHTPEQHAHTHSHTQAHTHTSSQALAGCARSFVTTSNWRGPGSAPYARARALLLQSRCNIGHWSQAVLRKPRRQSLLASSAFLTLVLGAY